MYLMARPHRRWKGPHRFGPGGEHPFRRNPHAFRHLGWMG